MHTRTAVLALAFGLHIRQTAEVVQVHLTVG